MLLFGGQSDRYPGYLGDTWSWNGTTWTKLSPATSPTARYGASMAYDPGTEAMLLFGDGYDGELNDTSRSASAMRAMRLSRISVMRGRWAGSGQCIEQRRHA
jgi:hypothetical protein